MKNFDAEGSSLIMGRCTNEECKDCDSDRCRKFNLKVSTERASSAPSPVLDCRNGDTVKLEKIDSGKFHLTEIAIIAKQGLIPL